MRIGCLQFAPQVGDVDNNLNRADAVLNRSDPDDLDLLVLPELAFSGYNFRSLQEISPYLEPSGSGITSLWTRTVALKYDCTVITGYPEKVDPSLKWPTGPEYYNAAIVVNEDGETIANYRKDHLHFTDEKWALEGSRGFFQGFLPGLGPTAIGICTDLNPYRWQAPWHKFEFAHHVLDSEARIVVIPMAWTTQEDSRSFSRMPQEPDMTTLTYWISRLEPIIRAESEEETIVIFANRIGTEEEITYTGTSAVVGIKSGEVYLYGVLGRGDKDLLVVDTEAPPYAKLVYRPQGQASVGADASESSSIHEGVSHGVHNPEDLGRRDKGREAAKQSFQHRATSSPSYRRHDLSVKIGIEADNDLDTGLISIHTPTAPSPTPHSIRPRLTIPPIPSITQRYLESHMSGPHVDTPVNKVPGFILGGEVRFDAPYPLSATSATFASESHFSESSAESPQLHSASHTRLQETVLTPHHMNAPSPNELFALELKLVSDENGEQNRHSIRSDVSVWNNHQGRPRSVATLPNPSEQPASIEKSQPGDAYRSAETSVLAGHNQALPQRPSSPKSRHASRSRGAERSNSTVRIGQALSGIQRKLEDAVGRPHSAQSFRQALIRSDADFDGHEHYDLHNEAHDQGRTPFRSQTKTPARALSRMSIPIAMDSSLWASTSRQGEIPVGASGFQASDSPILRPFTRERIRSMSESNRKTADGDMSHESGESRTRPVGYSTRDTVDDEQSIRGRERFARAASIQNDRTTTPERQKRPSTSTNQSELIDLSKFTLIEEYPSPHCPVHGRQSRMGAQHHHRPPSTTEQSQQRKSPQVLDESVASSNRSSSTNPETTSHHPSSSQNVPENPEPPTSVTSSSRIKALGPSSGSRNLPTRHSPLGIHQEPKTPKAMNIRYDVLSDKEDGSSSNLPPHKQNHSSEDSTLMRPKSCTW